MVSLSQVKYDDQERCFKEMITQLPFTQVLIDQNGIGSQLAENLTQTGKAQGVDFTNATKELWAVEARLQAERGNVPIPLERDLAYQIHSIKKKVTAAKNNVFDTERNEKHHADKFWSWALAIWTNKTSAIADQWIRAAKQQSQQTAPEPVNQHPRMRVR
jgi:phage FluMu gp28-like protein